MREQESCAESPTKGIGRSSMKSTERKEEKPRENGNEKMIPELVSKPSLEMSKLDVKESKNLLLSSASFLLDMMEEMAIKKDDPRYVNAACGCAREINKLLKFNLELMKISQKR